MTEGAPSERLPAVIQAMHVIEALVSTPDGEAIRKLAATIGASRNSTHRVLQALAAHRYADQDDYGRYSIGPRMLELASKVLQGSSFLMTAREVMGRLVDQVQETAYLALFDEIERSATYVVRVESHQPLQYVQPIGSRIPLDAGAAGKAIYAHSHLLQESGRLDPAEIEKIRTRGFSVSVQERVEGASGVAAPIWSSSGLLGSITLTIPVVRLSDGQLEELGPIVSSHAREISRRLGYHDHT